MAKLIKALSVQVWDSKRVLNFKDTDAITTWAAREKEFWTVTPKTPTTFLTNLHQNQSSLFSNFMSWTQQIANYASATNDPAAPGQQQQLENTLESQFNAIRTGTVLTTECKQFKELSRLKKIDPDGFILLAAASRSNAREAFQSVSNSLIEIVSILTRVSLGENTGSGAVDETYESELAELKNRYETRIHNLTAQSETLQVEREAAALAETEAASTRSTEWRAKIEEVDAQWKKALRVYDEEMALQAPATYWRSRANWSMVQASIYALVFTGAVATALVYFFADAVPYLHDMAKPGVSIVTASLPVLVPTFAIVWVLRIIGRLLSESLQLIRDGRERETMVKTFLALMNDETRGKALVTDDDRLLILHALFRPSSISATDDSPPVHWFDILTRKYGAK